MTPDWLFAIVNAIGNGWLVKWHTLWHFKSQLWLSFSNRMSFKDLLHKMVSYLPTYLPTFAYLKHFNVSKCLLNDDVNKRLIEGQALTASIFQWCNHKNFYFIIWLLCYRLWEKLWTNNAIGGYINQGETWTFWSVWPDVAIFWTLGNFLKPLATIYLPKSPNILRQFL